MCIRSSAWNVASNSALYRCNDVGPFPPTPFDTTDPYCTVLLCVVSNRGRVGKHSRNAYRQMMPSYRGLLCRISILRPRTRAQTRESCDSYDHYVRYLDPMILVLQRAMGRNYMTRLLHAVRVEYVVGQHQGTHENKNNKMTSVYLLTSRTL